MGHPLVITVIQGGIGARGSDSRSTFRYERLGHSDDDTQLATPAILDRLPAPLPTTRRGRIRHPRKCRCPGGGARAVVRWADDSGHERFRDGLRPHRGGRQRTGPTRTGRRGSPAAGRSKGSARVLPPGCPIGRTPHPGQHRGAGLRTERPRERDRTRAMRNNGIVKALGRVYAKLDVPGLLAHPTARRLAGPASTMVLRCPRGRVDKATDF